MKESIKKIWLFLTNNKLVNSLDNVTDGFSFRKLLSLFILYMIYKIHETQLDKSNSLEFTKLDYIGIAVLLGLVSLDRIMSLFNGKTGTVETTTATESTKVTLPIEELKDDVK